MRLRLLLVFLLIAPALHAQSAGVLVNITESGKVTSYFDEYWVVNVEGTITIHNPYNTSFDYILIPINLGTLTVYEGNSSDMFKQTQIYHSFLEAGETVSAGYQIRGISAYDPMSNNRSVLRSAIQQNKANLYTFMISNIKKSEIENETRSGEIKTKEKRRVVTVTLQNPSPMVQNVTSVRVIKTPDQDPNNELAVWSFPGPIIIQPGGEWMEDIADLNSTEGEVYWLSTEAKTGILPVFISDHVIKRFTQEDLFRVENDSLTQEEMLSNITTYLEHLMYLKKTVSDTYLVPGDLVSVSVKVNNFAPIHRDIKLEESIPSGFRLVSDLNSTGRNIVWNEQINPDTSSLFSYELEFYDNDTVGLDYFEPAVLTYENETMYSERIPFIRQYIPEKKIFIQKKLRYSLADEIVVDLQVQNLGESRLEDVYVKEFLAADDVFREISVAPEDKGRWKIPVLEQGEAWEVTYVTNENKAVNLLPEVYGVDNKVVLKTLVFENIIRNEWVQPAMRAIEIIAPLFILGFIVFYFVYQRRIYSGKALSFMMLGRKIKKLKKDTDLKPDERIGLMKRESKTSKDIPSVEPFRAAPSKDKLKEMAHENIDKLKQIDEDSKSPK